MFSNNIIDKSLLNDFEYPLKNERNILFNDLIKKNKDIKQRAIDYIPS